MRRMKLFLPVLVLVAGLACIPAANAQTVLFIGVGSSALFNPMGIATVNDTGFPVGTIHHFTIKGGCSSGNCAQVIDNRPGINDFESANLWVVYHCTVASVAVCPHGDVDKVWAYYQVDSTVGDRAFFSRASGGGSGATGAIDSCTKTSAACAGLNLISQTLLHDGVNSATAGCGAATTCDDLNLQADVWTALGGTFGAAVTAGFTDIRAEDGLYATQRANAPGTGVLGTNAVNPDGLGYAASATANKGSSIESAFSLTNATPINFGLPGTNDPINSVPVPTSIVTFDIGESPIVYLINRTSPTGFGQVDGAGNPLYTNVIDNTAPLGTAANYPLGKFVGGDGNCNGLNAVFGPPAGAADFPVHVVLREPLSGTMNTAEFSSFRIYGETVLTPPFGHGANGTSVNNSPTFFPPTSQEMDTFLPADEKLSAKPCSGGVGDRSRAIGTGEMVNTAIFTAPAPLGSTDVFGYAFFTFGNVSKIALNNNFSYLTLDGVDPIFQSPCNGAACPDPGQRAAAYTENGDLPACGGAGQPACTLAALWAGGNSYPNLRNGTYRAWSPLRAYCDSADPNCQGALGVEEIIAHAQCDIHNSTGTAPDFLPFYDATKGFCGAFNDIGVIRAHYTYRLNSAHSPNKYAFSHSIEKFVLEANGNFGGYNNLAMNQGNPSANWPEQGGDAGGCIVPAGKASFCQVTKGNFASGTITYSVTGCTNGSAGNIAAGDYVTVTGLQFGGDGGAGDPDNGVFQVTSTVGSPLTKVLVAAGTGVSPALPPAGGKAWLTGSTGCSQ